jgi:hypothetical protein
MKKNIFDIRLPDWVYIVVAVLSVVLAVCCSCSPWRRGHEASGARPALHHLGSFQGLVIRHDLNRCNRRVTAAAHKVVPGMRIPVVFLWLVLEKGLIAAASLAIDLFPWHTLFC